MVHPVTGEHITSYQKLMNDPATAEVWMMAFGKGFGGMCQGDKKTNTIGTDAIFVMDPKDVPIYQKTNLQRTPRSLSLIAPKKMILIASTSQQEATKFTTQANSPPKRQT